MGSQPPTYRDWGRLAPVECHLSECKVQDLRVVTYATTYSLTPPHGTHLTPQPKELVP